MESKPTGRYVLGNDAMELARLDRQAAVIEPATRLLLQAAGIGSGIRVLDLGTGLGHVARLVGEIVGPTGSVVGVDQSGEALAIARQRTEMAGARHVSFVEGDVKSWRGAHAFDAIVGRLVLFHMPDPVAVVRHHLGNLAPGGRFVALDFDIGASRSEPSVPLADAALSWICEAFAAAGASPRIGARLGTILTAAGMQNVATFGVQAYLPPADPAGPAMLSGVVRSLAGVIIGRGIATSEQVAGATHDAIAAALQGADAVLMPPTVVGAWGTAG